MATIAQTIPRARETSFSAETAAYLADFLVARGWPILPENDEKQPVLLAYAPLPRFNEFQQILYRDGWNEGFMTVPWKKVADLRSLNWPGPTVFHLHWLVEFSDSKSGIEDFKTVVSKLKQGGRKIVWTVHNILPHRTESDKDIEIRKLVCEAADAIHIMNPRTVQACKEYFDIDPGKTFQADHPSYVGVYPDYVSREEARYRLGLGVDKTVFLAFGGIDAYKGIRELVAAYRQIRTNETCLVVAGTTRNAELAAWLREVSVREDDVVYHAATVPLEGVQYFFRAADFGICPYRRTLNSGAVLLAMTFSLPVIAPAIGPFEDILQAGRGILYDPDAADGLASAMQRAYTDRTQASPDACGVYAAGLRPSVVSPDFLRKLRVAVCE